MHESPKQMPAWQDITLEEIRAFLADEQVARAVSLAQMRYEGIKSSPSEIDAAIKASEGAIAPDLWRIERDALAKEIVELETILSQYSK